MRISFPFFNSSNGFSGGYVVDLPWNQATGNYQGLLSRFIGNVAPGEAVGGTTVSTPVVVTSNVETTSAGTRRVLVKIDLPYVAVKTAADGTVTYDKDNSGSNVSLHVVLSVPAVMTSDLQGNSDIAGNAAAHIAILLSILGSLMRNANATGSNAPNGVAQPGSFTYPWEAAPSTADELQTLVQSTENSVGVINASAMLGTTNPLLRGAVGLKPLYDGSFTLSKSGA